MVRGKPQRIRDPIHDLIEFDGSAFEQVCWEALQTRPFQRLRRIKQLGFSDLVYPGATHSRFAHSVGVFHTARQLVGVLERKLGPEIITARANTAKIAALLHDVGHGPFSHSFEDALNQLGIKRKHESWTARIIRETEICNVLAKLDDSSFADRVAKMIMHEGSQDIYSSIVSSQFDADRLDYMRRDRMMSGTQHAAIDFSWLLANLEVDAVPASIDEMRLPDVQTFVLGPKANFAAEAYVLGLFQLYPTVYYHKATRGAEKLFSLLMVRLGTHVKNGSYVVTNLPKDHPIIAYLLDTENLEFYLSLDDAVIWGALHILVNSKDKILSECADRILNRKFYKAIDIYAGKSASDEESKKLELALDNEPDLSGLLRVDDSMPAAFVDRAERNPYKRTHNGSGGINQIYAIDKDKVIRDLSDVSHVVKSIIPHRHYRIYVRDDETLNKVKQIIHSVGGSNAH
jgi:uncharacterized protein